MKHTIGTDCLASDGFLLQVYHELCGGADNAKPASLVDWKCLRCVDLALSSEAVGDIESAERKRLLPQTVDTRFGPARTVVAKCDFQQAIS